MNKGPEREEKQASIRVWISLWVLFSLLLGLQVATQYLAHHFKYQPALGASFNSFYAPWSFFFWWQKWQGSYPQSFQIASSLGIFLASSGLMSCLLFNIAAARKAKTSQHLHGSARWAKKKDILAAGLLGNEAGVYVGAWIDKEGRFHYLRHNGPEHILTYAPTRSGKGVGLVIPTLLSWPHSVLITDLKGELWAITAGWRKKYAQNKVIRFEPAAAKGVARWNPLDEIRLNSAYEVGDVQNLATLIIDPDGKGLESHWQKTSQALLVGLILHALYLQKNARVRASLAAIDQMLANSEKNIADLLTEMSTYKHSDGKNHPVVGAAARDMIDRPENEAGSVLSTLKSYLSLYRDPIVAQNVSESDFRIKDLMNHDSPVSLYIITQPNDKSRLQPLVRTLINMVVRLLADKMEFERVVSKGKIQVRSQKNYKHRLLGMIDEFPSLGKLDILQESLAFVAGYGIKFYLICQDINQLKSRESGYGPDESITSNCHIQNAYPPNRVETAEHLSKLTGLTTIVKDNITSSGQRTSLVLKQVSHSIQEVQRPLLTVDECLRMPGPKKDAEGQIKEAGDMVIYVAGFPAIYGKQPLYFQDKVFNARAAIEAPLESDFLIEPFKTISTEVRLCADF